MNELTRAIEKVEEAQRLVKIKKAAFDQDHLRLSDANQMLEEAKLILQSIRTDLVGVNGVKEPPMPPGDLEDMDFSVRTYNCLRRAGINTIELLCEWTPEDVYKIRNLGRRSFEEIRTKLGQRGLHLKGDEVHAEIV